MGLGFLGLEAARQFQLVLQEGLSPGTFQMGARQCGAKCPLSCTLQKGHSHCKVMLCHPHFHEMDTSVLLVGAARALQCHLLCKRSVGLNSVSSLLAPT